MRGISIEVRDPLASGGDLVAGGLAGEIAAYSHTLALDGGYQSAQFTLPGSQVELENWFEYGLGRHIITYNAAGQVIFEGFVNKLTVQLGGRSLERGPLMDMVNRVQVIYSTIDTSVDPPVLGQRVKTPLVEDLDSQARYGMLAELYSASGMSDAGAVELRDLILAENRWPTTGGDTLTFGGGEPAVRVECLGYYAYLNKYTYLRRRVTGTIGVSTKILHILAANPNAAFFSSDLSRVTANSLPTPAAEHDDPRALELIRAEVARGDAAGWRWSFGIYAGRQAVYAPLPAAYAYQYRLSEARLEAYGGGEIDPWDVLPGQWIFYPDFLAGRPVSAASLRDDPRATLIETVTYTAPYGIQINGGRARRLPQLLARLGLGGGA